MSQVDSEAKDSVRVITHIRTVLSAIRDEIKTLNPRDTCELYVGEGSTFDPMTPAKAVLGSVIAFGRPSAHGGVHDIVIVCGEHGPGRMTGSYEWRASNGEAGLFDVEATPENLQHITDTLKRLAQQTLAR